MPITYDYSGKTALVTGAGSGIGKATAQALGAAGAKIYLADINMVAAEEVAHAIIIAGGTAQPAHLDVADELAVSALVEQIVERSGRLDLAVNNAGIEADIVPLAELSSDVWRRVVDVNLNSIFYCLKAEIQAMLKSGGGAIVNTASASGLIGGYRLACYTATKHAVIGLTKASAMDYADKGIRINALCPGPIDTPFTQTLPQKMRDRLLFGTPINRMGSAEEMASAMLWLLSEDASYVVGHPLAVDGGVVLGGTGTRMEDLWSEIGR